MTEPTSNTTVTTPRKPTNSANYEMPIPHKAQNCGCLNQTEKVRERARATQKNNPLSKTMIRD